MSDNFEKIKAPDEILDFAIDWSNIMGETVPVDVVATSAWTLEDSFADNLTIAGNSIEAPDVTVVRVSGGGRLGSRHYLTNRITTAGGQLHQRTIVVTMRNR
jgi:hypothetical protein